jgi:hypothetical protein
MRWELIVALVYVVPLLVGWGLVLIVLRQKLVASITPPPPGGRKGWGWIRAIARLLVNDRFVRVLNSATGAATMASLGATITGVAQPLQLSLSRGS